MDQLNLFPTIQERFDTHLLDNDSVWESFENRALIKAKSNPKRISGKFIIESIRDEKNIEIDNTFTSRYVRKFITIHPQYGHLFEIRSLLKD